MADKKLNPDEYANDHRVAYLVAEWKRLTQAERDSTELIEVDPSMHELATKELQDIAEQKEKLMGQMESIIGRQGERELQYETGVHRVQRVPLTEKQGRIHTSTASVVILPLYKRTKIELNPIDIEVSFAQIGRASCRK